MSWTYGEVMAALGDEAQPVPGGILVFRGKHIMVGLCHNGGGFDVTPEGMDILNEFEEPVVAPRQLKTKAKATTKPAAPAVDVAEVDNTDLG